MHDPVEIEVKFHLSSVDSTRDRILALGSTPYGRVFESNIRFEDAANGLKEKGVLLRLRKDQATRLTFKSLLPTSDKDFKIHRELEVQVDDFAVCQTILESLGFHPEQTYEKWRETFALADTELCIDTMPYGVFLEIEGEKLDIRHVADQLRLKWEERILLNYLEIFDIIRSHDALVFNDVTFDNFKQAQVDIRRYLPMLYAA
jgi:adenylate cyclase class 2